MMSFLLFDGVIKNRFLICKWHNNCHNITNSIPAAIFDSLPCIEVNILGRLYTWPVSIVIIIIIIIIIKLRSKYNTILEKRRMLEGLA